MLSEFPEKASSLLLLCSAAGSCSRPAAAAYGRLRNPVPDAVPVASETPCLKRTQRRGVDMASSKNWQVCEFQNRTTQDSGVLYPVEYMYPECILMYLKCILNALLHSNRIHVS